MILFFYIKLVLKIIILLDKSRNLTTNFSLFLIFSIPSYLTCCKTVINWALTVVLSY